MMMARTMMNGGGRRSGRTGRPALTTGWRASRGVPDGRAALLAALDAYRRGGAEAPVVCKWGSGSNALDLSSRGAQRRSNLVDGRDAVVPTRLPPPHQVRERNDNGWVVRQAQDGRGRDSCLRRNDGFEGHHGVERNGWSVEEAVAGPLDFVASTGEVDRHGDTVAPEGWRLDAYRGNPVVLWAHDYGEPAIGRAEAVWSDGRALRARLEFAPTEFARQVERLYRQGYQRGVSVGFRPLRFEERRDPVNGAFLGIRFLEQELLEISAVPVPANGGALLAEETLGSTAAPAETGRALDEVVELLRGLRN